jgi:hypothetical protein
MPYIKPEKRADFSITAVPEDAGELNYAFTFIIKKYLEHHPLKYQTLNDIVGALEGAKLELYRRLIAPYEDEKIKENGDVY